MVRVQQVSSVAVSNCCSLLQNSSHVVVRIWYLPGAQPLATAAACCSAQATQRQGFGTYQGRSHCLSLQLAAALEPHSGEDVVLAFWVRVMVRVQPASRVAPVNHCSLLQRSSHVAARMWYLLGAQPLATAADCCSIRAAQRRGCGTCQGRSPCLPLQLAVAVEPRNSKDMVFAFQIRVRIGLWLVYNQPVAQQLTTAAACCSARAAQWRGCGTFQGRSPWLPLQLAAAHEPRSGENVVLSSGVAPVYRCSLLQRSSRIAVSMYGGMFYIWYILPG